MKKIRRRNGADAMVQDDYILQDGEGFVIPLSMMDSKPVRITDSRGNPAGQRPGFLYSDGGVSDAVLETAHQQYKDDLSKRWMSDRWSQKPVAQPVRQQQADAASVEAGYAQYNSDIQNRWKQR